MAGFGRAFSYEPSADDEWPTPHVAPPEGFAAFILTHGRPKRIITHHTLRRRGYSGPIVLVLDDEDSTYDEHCRVYDGVPDTTIVTFSKEEMAERFGDADNFRDRRAIVHARNACWDIAAGLGLTHFAQFDDDYTVFQWRYDAKLRYCRGNVVTKASLNGVLGPLCTFLDETPFFAIALAQGGDFLGGEKGTKAQTFRLWRKAMNSWVCRTDRRIRFVGRLNEDVSAYAGPNGACGMLIGTTGHLSLDQIQTQAAEGGMSDAYADSGTYVKSMYTVMQAPSSTRVAMMHSRKSPRLHHQILWNNAVPKILREEWKK